MREGTVRLHDARTGNESLSFRLPQGSFLRGFSPDGSHVLIHGGDSIVRLRDTRTGTTVLSFKLPPGCATFGFSPDGAHILVLGTKHDVMRLYDSRSGKETLSLRLSQGEFFRSFAPDGSRILTGGVDGTVRLYDARTGKEALSLKLRVRDGRWTYSPDGTRIAAVDQDGSVRLYDARTGKEALSFKCPFQTVPQFSPDGKRIALVFGRTVSLHDAQTGKPTVSFTSQSSLLPFIQFSPDGTRLAVPARGLLLLLDVRTGKEVFSLPSLGYPSDLWFSPDGDSLAFSDPEHVLRVYHAPRDPVAWQAERRKALADGLPAWHRTRATESQAARDWFAAAFHWGRLALAEPDKGQHRLNQGWNLAQLGRATEAGKALEAALATKDLTPYLRAHAHAMLGQYREAAGHFAKVVEQPNITAEVWSMHAQFRLQQGDHAGYEKACAAILTRFAKTQVVAVANTVAWTCALGPDAQPNLKPAIELVQLAVRAGPKEANVRNTLGAILYRAGQYNEAIAELNEAIKLNNTGGSWADFVFLAMAHHRLGKKDAARRWLEKTRLEREKIPPVAWGYKLSFQLLIREAEGLILPKKDAKK